MQEFASRYAEALQKTASVPIFICDRDEIISVAGASKREYLERKISKGLEEIIELRSLYVRGSKRESVSIITDGGTHYVNCAMPILCDGDIIGCVLSGWQYDIPTAGKISDEIESKLVQTAAMFLGKQLEE